MYKLDSDSVDGRISSEMAVSLPVLQQEIANEGL
jgi:hypothetical protein